MKTCTLYFNNFIRTFFIYDNGKPILNKLPISSDLQTIIYNNDWKCCHCLSFLYLGAICVEKWLQNIVEENPVVEQWLRNSIICFHLSPKNNPIKFIEFSVIGSKPLFHVIIFDGECHRFPYCTKFYLHSIWKDNFQNHSHKSMVLIHINETKAFGQQFHQIICISADWINGF